MIHIKSVLTLCLFAFMCSITFFFALSTQFGGGEMNDGKEAPEEEANSYFEEVNYYLFNNNKKVLHLDASSLITASLTDEGNISFETPRGEAFGEDESEVIYFRADSGNYFNSKSLVHLKDEVQFNYDKAEFEAKVVKFWPQKSYFAAWGDVKSRTIDPTTQDKLEINSHEVQGWPSKKESLYKGEVRGKIIKKRVYQQGIEFESDTLKADLQNSLITMNGNILMKKQRLTAQSGRAEIFLENYNKKLKYYVLYDDIRIEEKLTLRDGQPLVRRAYSETLEGFQSLGKIVLSGAPRVIQGEDVIKGYQITLRENVELVEVDDANSVFQLKKGKQ